MEPLSLFFLFVFLIILIFSGYCLYLERKNALLNEKIEIINLTEAAANYDKPFLKRYREMSPKEISNLIKTINSNILTHQAALENLKEYNFHAMLKIEAGTEVEGELVSGQHKSQLIYTGTTNNKRQFICENEVGQIFLMTAINIPLDPLDDPSHPNH